MLKERSASIGSASEMTAGKDDRDSGTGTSVGPGMGQELGMELPTDADGWIYGDNKWEAASAKGGMGKYTRYRRWTRIAVLEETVEVVGPGELGIVRDAVDHSKSTNVGHDGEKAAQIRKEESITVVPDSPKSRDLPDSRESGEEKGSALRQRLRSAVASVRSSP